MNALNFSRTKWQTWGLKQGKKIPKVAVKDTFDNWKIWRGDTVRIMTGKFAGSEGKVFQVLRSRNQVVIEGINVVQKIVRNRDKNGKVESIDKMSFEMGIHVSNVALLDPSDGKPTRVAIIPNPEGKGHIRVSTRTNYAIPKVIPPKTKADDRALKNMGDHFARSGFGGYVTFTPRLDKSPIPEGVIL